MKVMFGGLTLALVLLVTAIPANAKGCIKGAVVGGLAGHYAGHHTLLGAAAGCLIGRHEAKKHDKATQNPSPDPSH
jgi:outer membrane lipoprotein SlyB